MARVNNIQTMLQNVKNLDQLSRYVSEALSSILSQFNGKLDFGDNIRASGPLSASFTAANEILAVPHSLGRTPQGYIILTQSASGSVLTPAGAQYAWTSSVIFLQASAKMNITFLAV